jgi:GxxExxY protein
MAMAVHSAPGSGFQEVIYQRALEIELNRSEFLQSGKIEIPVFHKGYTIGTRGDDSLAFENISVD